MASNFFCVCARKTLCLCVHFLQKQVPYSTSSCHPLTPNCQLGVALPSWCRVFPPCPRYFCDSKLHRLDPSTVRRVVRADHPPRIAVIVEVLVSIPHPPYWLPLGAQSVHRPVFAHNVWMLGGSRARAGYTQRRGVTVTWIYKSAVINTPGVAKAVLQTPLSLIN